MVFGSRVPVGREMELLNAASWHGIDDARFEMKEAAN
jgi:hypothetical protein